MADKKKVTVVVPPRQPHAGFWSHGKFYPTGTTEAWVTESELAELEADEARGFLALVAPPTLDQLYAMVQEAEEKLAAAKKTADDAEKAKADKSKADEKKVSK